MTDVPLSKLSFLFFVLLGCSVMFSCSDSDPEVTDARGFVVFDYQDDKSTPSVRFAAFAEASSEVQRVNSISVKCHSNGYEWICNDPVLLTDDKKQWAGYTDFVYPSGDGIPTGVYDLTYVDALDNSVTKSFAIFYKTELAKAKTQDVAGLMSENRIQQYCLYSEKGTLLYYGAKKGSWTDDKKIFASVRDSASYRICYLEPDKSVYCLMPPVYKSNIKENPENQENK